MATLNLGRVGFVNKGAYVDATVLAPHKLNDIVQYGTGTYACIQYHDTAHLPTDIAYWQKWTDAGLHTVSDISGAVSASADSQYINYFPGILGVSTGVISVKITGLVTATASTVDLGYIEITITQDDRDHSSATNPPSYKFMIKGNMDVGVWYNTQAIYLGSTATVPINVRFTRNATDAYIEIGEITDTWYYPTVEVSHFVGYIISGYTPVFLATIQGSLLGTTTDSIISVVSPEVGTAIHNATAKTTPVNNDEIGIWDSVSLLLRKVTFSNLIAFFYNMLGAKIQPITASVASNNLTVTLNPTSLDFRSSTIGDGTVNKRVISSPISLTVPSGATLGSTNGQLSTLAILAIDTAGLIELAICNTSGGLDLSETGIITTVAINTVSNSNNVIYSVSARVGVPYRVVGYIEITEATAGVYAAAPSLVQGGGGQSLAGINGNVIQQKYYQTGAVATTTTSIPIDDSIPQITEGVQFMSLAITPKKASSKLKIDIVFNHTASISSTIGIALFRDSTANAIGAIAQAVSAGGDIESPSFTVIVDASSIASTTFSVRAGTTGGTLVFNGSASTTRLFGGSFASSITITEIGA